MLGLALIASHLVGDFVFQTRWQAAGKLARRDLRAQHVFFYGVAFVPVVVWRIFAAHVGLRGSLFFLLLIVLHYATDSRRFRSTLGDWIGWRLMPLEDRADEVATVRVQNVHLPEPLVSGPMAVTTRPSLEAMRRARVPANPWEPIPLLIDQSLHLVQLALLGFLLV